MLLSAEQGATAAPEQAPEPAGRSRTPSMGIVFAVLVTFFGWMAGLERLSNSSFLWHMVTGHWILDHGAVPHHDLFSYTAAGHPWVAQSWLAETTDAAIERYLGSPAIRLFDAAIGAGIAYLAYRLAVRKTRDHVTGVFLALVAVVTSASQWSERPLFLGILAMLALVWVVEAPDSLLGRKPLITIPVLMWLWLNVHGTFPFGYGYLVLHLAGRWAEGSPPWRGRERRLAQGAGIAAVASLINPYGLDLLLFPIRLLGRDQLLHNVTEWQSPDFRTTPGMAFGLWLLLLFGVLALAKRRPTIRDFILIVVFALAGFWAQRNITLATLVILPIMGSLVSRTEPRVDSRQRLNWAALAGVILVGTVWTAQVIGLPAYNFDGYPRAAFAAAEQQAPGKPLITTDLWAGYVIHQYWPRQRVFYDDRYDMYPTSLTADYRKILFAAPGWQTILDRTGTDVVVWPTKNPLTRLIQADPGWRQIHTDDWATVFVRNEQR